MDMVIFRTIFFKLFIFNLLHSLPSISPTNDLGIHTEDKTNEYIVGVYGP